MSYNSKPDVVKSIKETKEKYGKRSIYCVIVNNEDFYATSLKYDIDKLFSSSDEWDLSLENSEDIKAYHGFVLDVKNLPDELKPTHMRDRSVIVFRDIANYEIETTELETLAEAMNKIETEIADDGADIDEYLIIIGQTCELCLAVKEAAGNVLVEREVYGD